MREEARRSAERDGRGVGGARAKGARFAAAGVRNRVEWEQAGTLEEEGGEGAAVGGSEGRR